jgi:uncharacterized membrane protein
MRIKIPTKEELAKKYKREFKDPLAQQDYLKNKETDTSILRQNLPKEEEQSKDKVSIKEEATNIKTNNNIEIILCLILVISWIVMLISILIKTLF